MWLFLIDLADYTAVLLADNSDIPFAAERSVPEVRHFNISKKDRRISETRLSSYLYVFLYNTSSTGV